MALTNRQKNIPNYIGVSQDAPDYSFADKRNKQVQEAIHTGFLATGKFPAAGNPLAPVGELTQEARDVRDDNRELAITRADLDAYAASYPQNAYVEEIPIPGSNDTRAVLTPVLIGDVDSPAYEGLELYTNAGFDNLLTVTTPESQKPKNQGTIYETAPTGADRLAQIPAFPLSFTDQRVGLLLETIGFQNKPIIDQDFYASVVQKNPSGGLYSDSPPEDLNYYDWTANVTSITAATTWSETRSLFLGDGAVERIYYNPDQKSFFCAIRTTDFNPSVWDLGTEAFTSAGINNVATVIQKAAMLEKILRKFGALPAGFNARSHITEWQQNSGREFGKFETVYGSLSRPNPPAGTTVWSKCFILPEELYNQIARIDPNAHIGARASIPHPVTIQKLIAEGAGGGDRLTGNKSFRAPFTLGELKLNIEDSIAVLKYYKNEMSKDGVSPSHFDPEPFNIDLEIENLEKFLGEPLQRIISLISLRGEAWDDDAIEFVLDESFNIHWVSYNGNIVLKDPQSMASRLTPEKFIQQFYKLLQNQAPSITPRTMCYIWNSKAISQIKGRPADKRPPWSVFISSATLGNPKYDPNKNQARKLKDKNQTTDSIFLTPAQVDAAVKASMALGVDMLRQIPGAAGECDTTLAKIAKELYVFGSYYFGPKTDWKSIITRAVFLARDELVELEGVKELMKSDEYQQAQAFAGSAPIATALTNPAAVKKEIERKIDQEISCALDIVGGSLQAQLKAMGVPPAGGQLARNAFDAMPPIKLAFKKTGNKGFFSLWGDALMAMAINFTKQMILSVVKDMLKAALCPPPTDDETTPVDIQMSTYGLVQVNDLVKVRGDIDLVEVANEVGIKFKFYKTENEEKKESLREPTLRELKQFNNDASDMLMRKEMLSLLQGEPFQNVSANILEVVKRKRPEQLENLSEDNRNDPIEVDLVGDSLSERDTRYAGFDLDTVKINNYFALIGTLLGNLENVIDPLPPEIAYCDTKNPQPPGWGSGVDMGISQAQLQRQIDIQIQSKYDKIWSLCDFADGFGGLQVNLNSFMSAFEEPEWYKKFLKKIAEASAAAFGAAAEAQGMENSYPQVGSTPAYTFEDTKMWDAISPTLGQRLLKPKIKPFNGGVKWYIGDATLGYITVTFKKKSGWQAVATYDYHIPGRNNRVIVTQADTAMSNRTSKYIKVGNHWELDPNHLNSVGAAQRIDARTPGANANSLNHFRFRADYLDNNSNRFKNFYGGPFTRTWANKVNKNSDLANNQAFGPSVGIGDHTNVNFFTNDENLNSEGRWIRLMTNEYYDIRRAIISFYQMPVGLRRYPKFASVIGSPAFAQTENPCVTTDDENIAAAAIDGIQQRIVNFLLNVGYLFPLYGGWITPDIFNSIAAYLSKKIELDMREKGVFEMYVSSLDLVEKTMSRPLGTSLVDFNFENVEASKKFDYVVRQVYRMLLERIGRQTAYHSAAGNIVEHPTWLNCLHQIVDYFKTGRFKLQGANDNNRGRFPSPSTNWNKKNSVELSVDSLNLPQVYAHGPKGTAEDRAEGNSDPNREYWNSMGWTTYLPVFHIIAMQIIYADKIIDINNTYPKFKFYSGRRVTNADEALRFALNPEHLSIYSPAYSNFPVIFNNTDFYTEAQLRNQLAALQRLKSYLDITESQKTLIQAELRQARTDLDRGKALNGWADWEFLDIFLQQAENTLSSESRLTGEDLRSSDLLGRKQLRPDWMNDPETFIHPTHMTVKDYLSAMHKLRRQPKRVIRGNIGAMGLTETEKTLINEQRYDERYSGNGVVHIVGAIGTGTQATRTTKYQTAIKAGRAEARYSDVNANQAEVDILYAVGDRLINLANTNRTMEQGGWWNLFEAYANIVETFSDNNSVLPPLQLDSPRSNRGEHIALRVGDMYFNFTTPQAKIRVSKIDTLISGITSFLESL